MDTDFVEERAAILRRTPDVLDGQLRDLPEIWTGATDGEGTWSAYDVVGHLVHGEKTDWMVRVETLLAHGPSRPFAPFDREAQFTESRGVPLNTLLDHFRRLRAANLDRLKALKLEPAQLDLTGSHPTLGTVTLAQLLSTWAAHDLAHLLQINRTMARRYREQVGPFAQFLSVMR